MLCSKATFLGDTSFKNKVILKCVVSTGIMLFNNNLYS